MIRKLIHLSIHPSIQVSIRTLHLLTLLIHSSVPLTHLLIHPSSVHSSTRSIYSFRIPPSSHVLSMSTSNTYMYLFQSLSVYSSTVFNHLIYLSMHTWIRLPVHAPNHFLIHLFRQSPIYPTHLLSIHPLMHPFIHRCLPSSHPSSKSSPTSSIYLSTHPSNNLLIHPVVHASICPSIQSLIHLLLVRLSPCSTCKYGIGWTT